MTGATPHLSNATTRWLVVGGAPLLTLLVAEAVGALALLAVVVAVLVPLFSRRDVRRGLHDLVAGTMVIPA